MQLRTCLLAAMLAAGCGKSDPPKMCTLLAACCAALPDDLKSIDKIDNACSSTHDTSDHCFTDRGSVLYEIGIARQDARLAGAPEPVPPPACADMAAYTPE